MKKIQSHLREIERLLRDRRWTITVTKTMMKTMTMKKTMMMTMILEVGRQHRGRPGTYRRQTIDIW